MHPLGAAASCPAVLLPLLLDGAAFCCPLPLKQSCQGWMAAAGDARRRRGLLLSLLPMAATGVLRRHM